ncbi:hypothetical protein HDV02_006157 [Globomyces sp. JEL0801]|nr:hypothetical protein HDV02_006157 [Globomyces sp. JEL0801]
MSNSIVFPSICQFLVSCVKYLTFSPSCSRSSTRFSSPTILLMSNLFRSKSYKSYFAESHPSKADRLYLLDSQSDATLTDTLSISHSNQHTESDTHSNTQSDTDSNRVSPQPNYTTTRGPPNACLFVARYSLKDSLTAYVPLNPNQNYR